MVDVPSTRAVLIAAIGLDVRRGTDAADESGLATAGFLVAVATTRLFAARRKDRLCLPVGPAGKADNGCEVIVFDDSCAVTVASTTSDVFLDIAGG